MGRPKTDITNKDRKEIIELAKFGLRNTDIAVIKKIPISVLKRNCQDELTQGRITARSEVIKTAHTMAKSGDCPALTIFYLKTQCGWREKEKKEPEKIQDNKTINVTISKDPNEAAKAYQQIMNG